MKKQEYCFLVSIVFFAAAIPEGYAIGLGIFWGGLTVFEVIKERKTP